MTIEKNSNIYLQKPNLEFELNIHYFFVFNFSGVCIYGKNYTNKFKMDQNLISAFCSALISFSKEMVGKKLKIVDMDTIQIVIIHRQEFIYGYLCRKDQDLIILEDNTDIIDNRLRDFIKRKKINIGVQYIRDEKIKRFIDQVLKNNNLLTYKEGETDRIINFLEEFRYKNDIEGLILLNYKGKILYSSLNHKKLKKILQELDFRVKISKKSILKLFYTSKKELVYSEFINEYYFIVLLLGIQTPFGIAEFYLKKIINGVNKIQD